MKNLNKRPLIKTFLHYFILLFIYNLTIVVPNIVMERFNSQNENKISIVDLHKEGLCIFEAIEILFISLASILF